MKRLFVPGVVKALGMYGLKPSLNGTQYPQAHCGLCMSWAVNFYLPLECKFLTAATTLNFFL